MKFEIGQHVWLATFETRETSIECPDCAGTGRLRVVFADDTQASIECAGCQSGYNQPTGRVRTYERLPEARPTAIVGVSIEGDRTEWRTSDRYCCGEDAIFDNEADAVVAAQRLADQASRDELERIASKEKPTRTWSWNATYHRRCIKEAKRSLEYHSSKLAVANLKAKASKKELDTSGNTGA